MSFWTNYALALALVAVVLAALAVGGRLLKRATLRARSHGRFVEVVESAMLSPHANLHVVRAGRRYLLIGSTGARVCTLAEIDDPRD